MARTTKWLAEQAGAAALQDLLGEHQGIQFVGAQPDAGKLEGAGIAVYIALDARGIAFVFQRRAEGVAHAAGTLNHPQPALRATFSRWEKDLERAAAIVFAFLVMAPLSSRVQSCIVERRQGVLLSPGEGGPKGRKDST